jgi:Dyp-type peroxidase family
MTVATASPLADPQQIQGNILLPFRGLHQAYLFLSFGSDRTAARRWLGAAAGRVAGTADVNAARDGSGPDPKQVLLNIGLTATGLVLLHDEVAGDLRVYDAFWRGPLGTRLDDSGRLTTTAAMLGDTDDSAPQKWVIGAPDGPPVDALLTLAAEDESTLRTAVDEEIELVKGAKLTVLPLRGKAGGGQVQWGSVLRNAEGRRVEHFGFVDGLSQPGIRGFGDAHARPGSPVIAAGEFILGCPGERRPQTWAPRPSAAAWMRGGSFQVFRRLRQHPDRWWNRMKELREDHPEEAAARALGRRLDGRPLATLNDPEQLNQFDYRNDASGANTPLFAHIRKMNPRDELFRDRNHKMLRRGITFGPVFDPATPDDDEERGLIFNAYMTSIEHQFEFLQRRWANDPEFPASTLARYGRGTGKPQVDGLDPILGPDAETAGRQHPEEIVKKIPKEAFGGFVTTTGAVYAFAPPLPALRRLAGDDPI